jgi:hypothetical protein
LHSSSSSFFPLRIRVRGGYGSIRSSWRSFFLLHHFFLRVFKQLDYYDCYEFCASGCHDEREEASCWRSAGSVLQRDAAKCRVWRQSGTPIRTPGRGTAQTPRVRSVVKGRGESSDGLEPSTPSLPCAAERLPWLATGCRSACSSGFLGSCICDRLPPVAARWAP